MNLDRLKKILKYNSIPRLLATVVVISSSFAIFELSLLGDNVASRTARRIEFFFRHKLDQFEKIEDRIKIFIFDDPMASYLQTTDYSMDQWEMVLSAVQKKKPAAIIIDKLFGFPFGAQNEDSFTNRMQAINANVIVGAFTANYEIPGRTKLSSEENGGEHRNYKAMLPYDPSSKFSKPPNFLYGPDKGIRDGFNKIGHIVYAGNGYIDPILRFSDSEVIPHLSLQVAGDYKITNDDIYIRGKVVPTDRFGRILVNLGPAAYYQKKTFGMKALFLRALKGKDIPVINENDIVILLPAMFTGNTDWIGTPVEDMPGGYLLTASINTALTGNFIKKVDGFFFDVFIPALLGAIFAGILSPIRFWAFLVGAAFIGGIAGILSFVYLDVIIPWFYPIIAMIFSSLFTYAERSRREKYEQIATSKDLETASLVQDSFFPKNEIRGDYVNVAGFRASASECSGDWWFYFKRPGGLEYVLLGDAMGHGTPAALVTAMAYSSINSLINEMTNDDDVSPSFILAQFNRILYAALKGKFSMTFFIAAFNPVKNTMTYANAGHPFPIMLNPGQAKPKSLVGSGDPLGVREDSTYKDKTISVGVGDKLLCFTDGLIEAHDKKNGAWGRKKFFSALVGAIEKDAVKALEYVLEQAVSHHGQEMKMDDVTFIVAEFAKSIKEETESEKLEDKPSNLRAINS